MHSVIIVIHLMIVLGMVGLILLQKSEGGGLGMGSSGGGGFMSSRGSTNVLTRTTAILAATFFATSLILSLIAGMDRRPRSVLTPAGQPSPTAPISPSTPLGGPGGGVLDQLQGTPQPPQPPAGPQVPRSQ
jgi:preprotein translocase subunit SecG